MPVLLSFAGQVGNLSCYPDDPIRSSKCTPSIVSSGVSQERITVRKAIPGPDPDRYNRCMPPEQVFIGGATAALCLAGIWKGPWLLEHTRKGQRLVNWFGPDRAPWVLRFAMISGAIFGILLAIGIINPIRW